MKLRFPTYPSRSRREYIFSVGATVVLFALYFGTARFGLSLQAVSGFATLVWFPSGLGVAALLLFGYRLWPGILLGAFLVNLLNGAPLFVAVGIGVGNTLEALVGSALLKRHRMSHALDHLRDVFLLVLLAMPTSACISATLGVTSLLLGKVIALASYGPTWSAWWIGDMISILIVTPLLLVWSTWPAGNVSGKRLAEMGILAILVVGVGLLVFLGELHPDQRVYPLSYLVFPPLIWASLRFGPRGALLATLTFSVIAVVGTMRGLSPFSAGGPGEDLIFLQSFMGVSAVTSLLLAAMMAERRVQEQRKDEFISMAGHELKTPLTGLQGYTELLHLKFTRTGDQEALRTLSKMAALINRLTRLVGDLLDLSKIRAGKLPFAEESVDMDALVGEVVESLQQGGAQHRIDIEGSGQGEITGDRERLGQVLSNLLTNAMKYSPRTGQIIVRLARAHGILTVSVQDFGIGIPKAHQEKIFECFYRVSPDRDRTYPGLGMGLFIANQIVEYHGGKMRVESVEGQGSTFFFSLPAREPYEENSAFSTGQRSCSNVSGTLQEREEDTGANRRRV